MGNIAIITARGGSKRIPRKNIKLFCGRPIMEYSICAALESGLFEEVMVSTDDQEIGEIAEKCGAKVPFYRSEATSNDYATTSDVLLEVLLEYQKRGLTFDYMSCIYPTAPFVTAEKLSKAMDLLQSAEADSLMPVVSFSFPPQRASIYDGTFLKMYWPENLNIRSQDLQPWYHDCGQFYFIKTAVFLKERRLYVKKTIPMFLSELEVQDIDNETDWKLAEQKFMLCGKLNREE